MAKRKVVITGLGLVSPFGNDVPTFWQNVKANRSGVGPITLIDSSDLAVKIAGEVKNFDPSKKMDPKMPKKWIDSLNLPSMQPLKHWSRPIFLENIWIQ